MKQGEHCKKIHESIADPSTWGRWLKEYPEDLYLKSIRQFNAQDKGLFVPEKLYHIGVHPGHTEDTLNWHFIPRVPYGIDDREDTYTPRISMSDDIKRCMASNPYAMLPGTTIYLYEIKAKEYGLNNIVHYDTLKRFGLVSDAAWHHEYWLLKDIVLKGQKYEILNAEYEYDIFTEKAFDMRIMRMIIQELKDICCPDDDKIVQITDQYTICHEYKDFEDMTQELRANRYLEAADHITDKVKKLMKVRQITKARLLNTSTQEIMEL